MNLIFSIFKYKLQPMTTITIDNELNLSKTHFKSIEEFQIEILMMNERWELSKEHIGILKAREEEADNASDDRFSWEEVKSSLHRKNI